MSRTIIFGYLLFSLTSPLMAEVRVVHVPGEGRVPGIVQDAEGTLHIVYGKQSPGNAFYVKSRDGGKTFTAPVTVNRRADTVGCGMERGPRIALGKSGVIHVLLGGHYQRGGGVWYTRSTDQGKTFEPERKLNDPDYGLDNLALAADGQGEVFVLWTGGFPGSEKDVESPTASPIILVRSSDDGVTFSRNELLQSDQPASSFACGCCRLEAQVGSDSNLYVAFRGGYKSMRDPYLLIGKKSENRFRCIKISDDKWNYANCPMQGIPFHIDATGNLLASWMTRQETFFASASAGKSFQPRRQITNGQDKVFFPNALPAPDGKVFAHWQTRSHLQWRFFDPDGTPTEIQGRVPVQGDGKADALVGHDGNIYLIY